MTPETMGVLVDAVEIVLVVAYVVVVVAVAVVAVAVAVVVLAVVVSAELAGAALVAAAVVVLVALISAISVVMGMKAVAAVAVNMRKQYWRWRSRAVYPMTVPPSGHFARLHQERRVEASLPRNCRCLQGDTSSSKEALGFQPYGNIEEKAGGHHPLGFDGAKSG